MGTDAKGFKYPSVDHDKCISCGACLRVCPVNGNPDCTGLPHQCYAARMTDRVSQRGSSSGGAATAISKMIVEDGGVVYGCEADGLEVRHVRIDNVADLVRLRGSKYVQSDLQAIYRHMREDLKSGREVVFIGTPCQTAAIKKFAGNRRGNLLLVDLICHGVPSQQMLREHVRAVLRPCHAGTVERISFRNGKDYNFRIVAGGSEVWSADAWGDEPRRDLYFTAFLEGLTHRAGCYNCGFARAERVSDITIGDFWGLGDDHPFPEDSNLGTSLMLVNTEKGKELVRSLSGGMTLVPRSVEEAVAGNSQLRHPVRFTRSARVFNRLYPMFRFDTALRLTYKLRDISVVVKRMVRR